MYKRKNIFIPVLSSYYHPHCITLERQRTHCTVERIDNINREKKKFICIVNNFIKRKNIFRQELKFDKKN